MKPIQILIRKHTVVPTNYGSKYPFRTDLREVARINYSDSYSFFKCLNPNSPMTKDSEFAYWIYKTFGEGTYVAYAWMKGLAGMWVFMKVVLNHDGFTRMPKYESQEQKEKRLNVIEYKRLQKGVNSSDGEERKNLQEQIDNIKEDMDINKMIMDLDKTNKHGCYPYLKTTMPIYRFHSYETYEDQKNASEGIQEGNSLW